MTLAVCQAASRVLEHGRSSDEPLTTFMLCRLTNELGMLVLDCGAYQEVRLVAPRALEALVAAMQQLQVGWWGWDGQFAQQGAAGQGRLYPQAQGVCLLASTSASSCLSSVCANALVSAALAFLQAWLHRPHEPDATEWLSCVVRDFLSLPDRCRGRIGGCRRVGGH